MVIDVSNNGKIVVKYSLITFLICSALLISILIVLAVAFPKTMGDLMYNMGFKYNAISFYEKSYSRTEDINELYKIVNLSISTENDDKLIKNYEILLNRKKYNEFIDFINETNSKKDVSNLIKSSLLNEDDYLKNKYVKALINKNEIEKAIKFTNDNLTNLDEVDYLNLGCYAVSNFLNDTLIENGDVVKFFESNYKETEILVKNKLGQYFENLVTSFNTNSDSNEKAYLIAMAKRINLVGENIKFLNSTISTDYSNENINSKIIEVNKKLAELIK